MFIFPRLRFLPKATILKRLNQDPYKKFYTMSSELTKEQKLYNYVVKAPEDVLSTRRNKPEKVLDAFHQFWKEHEPMMIVGEDKGQFIIKSIKEQKQKVSRIAELGCYMGYSAVMFARELPADGKLYSFEVNEDFAKMATDVVALAGLSEKVEIIVGEAHKNLIKFAAKSAKPFDAVFIDHWQYLYVPDLRVLETLKLVAPGTVLYADNTLYPGAPEYLKYIRMSPEDKKQYIQDNPNENGQDYPGRWDIEWKNSKFESYYPPPWENKFDAVEMSEFVRYIE